MTDISSISFSETSYEISPPSSRSASLEVGYLLNQLEIALDQVKGFSGQATQLYFKMAGLIRQTQQKLAQVKKQNLQAHHKCLEHIQILLFQKDYKEALLKIDQYKKMQLTDYSFEYYQKFMLHQEKSCHDANDYTFQQAKTIINSQFADFELKEKIWLLYATQCSDGSQQLNHITYQQIQQAQLDKFKNQFSIRSQITQDQQYETRHMSTPEKKNSKSISYLKSQMKKPKNSSVKLKKKDKQKSACKLESTNKKSSQKRTLRKKGNKDQQESKTSKKIISQFV